MHANELFHAGKLKEAIQALGEELRRNPLDVRSRTFLFELLCFAGEWDRGEKQLDILAQGGKNAELGTLLYRAALHAERERQQFFRNKAYLVSPATLAGTLAAEGALATQSGAPVGGVLDEKPFQNIADADPRIGSRLEVFIAGRYVWLPFEHLASIEMQPPKRLRDLLWAPAVITNGPNFQGRDLGEVLLPVLSPFTSTHAEDSVRLGRVTVWEESDGLVVPFGQKLLLIDGEEAPLLELRKLQVTGAGTGTVAG